MAQGAKRRLKAVGQQQPQQLV